MFQECDLRLVTYTLLHFIIDLVPEWLLFKIIDSMAFKRCF
jgi:hypothetical protein